MAREFSIRELRRAVDAILDHVTDDLGIETFAIDDNADFYWEVPSDELHNVTAPQPQLDIGRLADDWEFIEVMLQSKGGAVALMLIHVAPLLRSLGERVGQ